MTVQTLVAEGQGSREQNKVTVACNTWYEKARAVGQHAKSNEVNFILEQKLYAIEGALQDQLHIQPWLSNKHVFPKHLATEKKNHIAFC